MFLTIGKQTKQKPLMPSLKSNNIICLRTINEKSLYHFPTMNLEVILEKIIAITKTKQVYLCLLNSDIFSICTNKTHLNCKFALCIEYHQSTSSSIRTPAASNNCIAVAPVLSYLSTSPLKHMH